MIEHKLPELPKGWVWTRIGEVSKINPKLPDSNFPEDLEVSFLPMKAIEERTGKFDLKERKKYGKVKKGYTPFVNGDIIFAKITPCMENGKIAILNKLINGVGFGSTEFHVIRLASDSISKKLYFYYLLQDGFRKDAQRNMTGSAGQLRVPVNYITQANIPLPPLPEQRRIVAKIEELFTRLDEGVEALKKVKAQLKRYRQAVLKYAFEGKLTEEWRKNVGANLAVAQNTGQEQALPLQKDLPELPMGWVWTRVGHLSDNIHYGYTVSASEEKVGPKLLRITDIQNNSVNWKTVPYCKIDESEKQKYLLKDGDLVFARTGATVGKSFLIVGNIPESVFASYLIRIIINDNIDKKFIYSFFQSTDYWRQISKGKLGIGQPNVNAQTLSQITIPLPSLLEQHKIVEEIERRFSIVDEVEKVVEESLKQAERLLQSILKKAFEGKLVPQDPTDEPAEKLLERIKAEKAQMETNKKGKSRISKRSRYAK